MVRTTWHFKNLWDVLWAVLFNFSMVWLVPKKVKKPLIPSIIFNVLSQKYVWKKCNTNNWITSYVFCMFSKHFWCICLLLCSCERKRLYWVTNEILISPSDRLHKLVRNKRKLWHLIGILNIKKKFKPLLWKFYLFQEGGLNKLHQNNHDLFRLWHNVKNPRLKNWERRGQTSSHRLRRTYSATDVANKLAFEPIRW